MVLEDNELDSKVFEGLTTKQSGKNYDMKLVTNIATELLENIKS